MVVPGPDCTGIGNIEVNTGLKNTMLDAIDLIFAQQGSPWERTVNDGNISVPCTMPVV